MTLCGKKGFLHECFLSLQSALLNVFLLSDAIEKYEGVVEGHGGIPPGSEDRLFLSSCLLVFGLALLVYLFIYFFCFLIAVRLAQLFYFSKSTRICWCVFFSSCLSVFCVCFGPCGRNIYLAQISMMKKKDEYSQTECIMHRIPGNLVGRVFDSNQAAAVCFRVFLLWRFRPSHVFVFLFSCHC